MGIKMIMLHGSRVSFASGKLLQSLLIRCMSPSSLVDGTTRRQFPQVLLQTDNCSMDRGVASRSLWASCVLLHPF